MCWFNLYVDFIALQTLLRWALVANECQSWADACAPVTIDKKSPIMKIIEL